MLKSLTRLSLCVSLMLVAASSQANESNFADLKNVSVGSSAEKRGLERDKFNRQKEFGRIADVSTAEAKQTSVSSQKTKQSNLDRSTAQDFLKRSYEKDGKFSVTSIKTTKILKLTNGFEAHFVKLNLNFKPLGKMIEKNDILFVGSGIFTTDIINLKTKTSMRDELLGEKIGVTYERLNNENYQNCN